MSSQILRTKFYAENKNFFMFFLLNIYFEPEKWIILSPLKVSQTFNTFNFKTSGVVHLSHIDLIKLNFCTIMCSSHRCPGSYPRSGIKKYINMKYEKKKLKNSSISSQQMSQKTLRVNKPAMKKYLKNSYIRSRP